MEPKEGFTFGQWNAGSNEADYKLLLRYRKDAASTSPNLGDLYQSLNEEERIKLDKSLNTVRDQLLAQAAQDMAHTADVFSLQEVSGDDRPDIRALKENGFEIIRPPRKGEHPDWTDEAIAIHPRKFKDIENRSGIAVATEIASGKKIAFVSGHIAGFQLEADDKVSMHDDAGYGNKQISKLLEKLDETCADCDTLIVGVDMNASPEIYQHRFNLFSDAGFSMHRTGKPTQIMPEDFAPKLPLRELDYVFVRNHPKQSKFDRFLRKLFGKEKVHVGYIAPEKNTLTLDPISSPSDHLPVFLRVEEEKSIIRTLVSSVKKHLGIDKATKELNAIEKEIARYNYTKQNQLRDSLIEMGFLSENDSAILKHDNESLKRLTELNEQLIAFKNTYLSGASLSPRKFKMLERVQTMQNIIAHEITPYP